MDAINANMMSYTSLPPELQQSTETSQAQATSQTQAAGAVSAEQSVASGSQVRVSESRDQVGYVQSHPQLEESANLTGQERSELLQSTSEKVVSAETTCRGNSVMFDIYAVLALIQETSQEMRNAERDMRMAEVQSVVSSIETQAALQRTSAVTQLIAGSITAGISISMSVGSTIGTSKGTAKAAKSQDAAGLQQMKMQEKLTLAEGDPIGTKSNLEMMTPKDQKVKLEVDQKMAQAGAGNPLPSEKNFANELTEVKKAETEVKKAETEVMKAKEAVKNKENTIINEEQPEEGGGEDVIKEKLSPDETLKQKTDELAQKKTFLAEKRKALTDAMNKNNKSLRKEATARNAELEHVVDEYQEEFDKVAGDASAEFAKKGAVSPETQAALEKAGAKLNYARAIQLDKSANMRVKPETDHTAFSKVSARVQHIKTHSDSTSAQATLQAAQAVGMSVAMVNALGSSVGQGVGGIFQAASTAEQAEQKMAEEELDQVKDLFANTQQVIQQAIQLFQSVTSKESQSIEEIISGIKA